MRNPNWRQDDFGWIYGMNYTPSYASNDVMTWRDFDAEVIDRELAYAQQLGLNSVRVWLQYLVFEHQPEKFAADFEAFLGLCDKHGLTVMPILFDSCFGDEPKIDWNGHWVMSPGASREVPEFWPQLHKYVQAVVGEHQGDERIVMWDIMNEPAMSDRTIAFVKHWCKVVREMDASHPVTVGVAGGSSLAGIFADDQDVLSMHSYAPAAGVFRYQINLMKELGRKVGKPVIITECCSPGWGCRYEMCYPVLRETGIGHYSWEVVLEGNQFASVSGLLYADGSCRRASEVAAVMGVEPKDVPFPEKPDAEGIPVKVPPDEDIVSKLTQFRELASTPTRPEEFRERWEKVAGLSITLGGLITLELDEVRSTYQIFFDLAQMIKGNDVERGPALLDQMVNSLARHLEEIDLAALAG